MLKRTRHADGTGSKGSLTVLAWPARRNVGLNPYQKLLYDAVEAESPVEVLEFRDHWHDLRAPAILHLHWPDVFLANGRGWRFWPRYLLLRLLFLVAWLRGTRVVWTAHNFRRAGGGNDARMDRLFWPWFLNRLDGLIFLTRVSAREALTKHPELADKAHVVIPHGHYRPVIGLQPADAPHRAPDGPPGALFFGSIAPYKNAYRVLEAFLDLPPGAARLAICGRMNADQPDTRLMDALAALPADRTGDVSFEDRFLSEDELIRRIRAADLVVFPYGNVQNSGAAIFALSVGRPILATDIALFRELQHDVGENWVRLIPGELTGPVLAEALAAARATRATGEVPALPALEWDRIGRATADFYARVAGQSG